MGEGQSKEGAYEEGAYAEHERAVGAAPASSDETTELDIQNDNN